MTNASLLTAGEFSFTDADWFSMGGMPGVDGYVYALATDQAGNLYAGGLFTIAGQVPATRIARWDGTTWSALGSGVNGVVNAIAISGSSIYVGGNFTVAGGLAATNIARWDGTNWFPLGPGLALRVAALAVSGTNLYAGGNFGIAKWNGVAWSALG